MRPDMRIGYESTHQLGWRSEPPLPAAVLNKVVQWVRHWHGSHGVFKA